MEPLSPGSAAKDVRRLSAQASTRGDCAEAVRMLELGCAETVRRIGPLHACHADLLLQLAAAYSAIGRHREAIASQLQALEILAALHGKSHPHYLRTLGDTALLQQRAGALEPAELSFRHACALQQCLPERQMEAAESHSRLAWLLFAQGRTDTAWAAVREAEACRDQAIRALLGAGPERTQQTALADIQAGYQLWLAIALDQRWAGPTATALAFELVQRRKLLRLHCSLSLRLHSGAAPVDSGLKSRWIALRRQLADATLKLRDGDTVRIRGVHDQRMALDELERRLVDAVAGAPDAMPGISQADDLAAALPADTCLVELVRYRAHRLPQSPQELPAPEDQCHYAAFVVRGGKAELSLHDLGPADTIDRLVHRHRRQLATGAPGAMRGLLDATESDPEPAPGERLRNLLIDPLRQAWSDCRRLVFAVDGELALLPLETLPEDSSNRFLADHYVISYLNVAREWLGRSDDTATRADVVVAAPSFDTRWSPVRVMRWLRRRDEPHEQQSRAYFSPLPGSRIEGQWVARRLQSPLWLGRRASKPALLGLHAPRILHIACHGYFRRPAQADDGPGEWLPPQDTPMLRAGLALTGANAGDGSGLLTAEEIATMDLHGTEMVVLSACDSGIGETTAGEGVTGLRRALALAGTRSLVVSLWKVDDGAAALLMDRFYRNLVDRRLSRGDALAQAKAELRRMTVGELRASGVALGSETFIGWGDHQRPFEHPFHWGAFVLSGCPDALPTSS